MAIVVHNAAASGRAGAAVQTFTADGHNHHRPRATLPIFSPLSYPRASFSCCPASAFRRFDPSTPPHILPLPAVPPHQVTHFLILCSAHAASLSHPSPAVVISAAQWLFHRLARAARRGGRWACKAHLSRCCRAMEPIRKGSSSHALLLYVVHWVMVEWMGGWKPDRRDGWEMNR